MRKTLSLLAVLTFALALAAPALAAPPKFDCSFWYCCRQSCSTSCIALDGSYQTCLAATGVCDGACDLASGTSQKSEFQPEIDDLKLFLGTEPTQTPVPPCDD